MATSGQGQVISELLNMLAEREQQIARLTVAPVTIATSPSGRNRASMAFVPVDGSTELQARAREDVAARMAALASGTAAVARPLERVRRSLSDGDDHFEALSESITALALHSAGLAGLAADVRALTGVMPADAAYAALRDELEEALGEAAGAAEYGRMVSRERDAARAALEAKGREAQPASHSSEWQIALEGAREELKASWAARDEALAQRDLAVREWEVCNDHGAAAAKGRDSALAQAAAVSRLMGVELGLAQAQLAAARAGAVASRNEAEDALRRAAEAEAARGEAETRAAAMMTDVRVVMAQLAADAARANAAAEAADAARVEAEGARGGAETRAATAEARAAGEGAATLRIARLEVELAAAREALTRSNADADAFKKLSLQNGAELGKARAATAAAVERADVAEWGRAAVEDQLAARQAEEDAMRAAVSSSTAALEAAVGKERDATLRAARIGRRLLAGEVRTRAALLITERARATEAAALAEAAIGAGYIATSSSLSSECSMLKRSLTLVNDRHDEERNRANALQEAVAAAAARQAELTARLSAAEAAVGAATDLAAGLELSLAGVASELTDAEITKSALFVDRDASRMALASTHVALAEMAGRMQELGAHLASMTEEASRDEAEIGLLRSALAASTEESSSGRDMARGLHAAVRVLTEQTGVVARERETAVRAAADVAEQLARARAEIAALGEVGEEKAAAVSALASMTSSLMQLQAEAERVGGEAAESRTRNARHRIAARVRIAALTQELTTARAAASSTSALAPALASAESELHVLKSALGQLTALVRETGAELEETRVECDTAQDKVAALTAELVRAREDAAAAHASEEGVRQ